MVTKLSSAEKKKLSTTLNVDQAVEYFLNFTDFM